MKQISLVLSMVLFAFSTMFAQITGTVSDDLGEALIGANVLVKGTTTGVITDFDGKYSISANEGDVLVISYTGYTTKEETVGSSSVVDVTLSEGIELTTAVVTALGVSREQKSIGYAVQEIDGAALTQARESNIVNSLSGKIAGVQITNSSGSVGASSRILLRGAASLTGNNQPLYIVDGVPLNNSSFSSADSGGGFDQPNGIADINPDDIESVTVLKGPNAAALYGLRASNGVIVLTTKTGKSKKSKGLGVSFNSSTTFETPLILPDFQNSYGQGGSQDYFEFVDGQNGDGGIDESWGPPLDVGLEFVQFDSYKNGGAPTPWVSNPDNVRDFYDTGVTTNNNVSFNGGDDNGGFRLSLGYGDQTGMVPNTDARKYTVSANSFQKFGDKLKANLAINYVKRKSDNLPTGGYNNDNVVQQQLWSGRQIDLNALRDFNNLPLAGENTAAAGTPLNWNTLFQNNPFWVLHTNLNTMDKDRLFGNVELSYELMDGLSLRAKTGADYYSHANTARKAQGTNGLANGNYSEINRNFFENNTEAFLSYTKDLTEDFDFNVNVGGNMMRTNYSQVYGEAPELELPGVYNVSNVKSGVVPVTSNFKSQERINSLIAFGQFGYKNAIYLDWTARNDWSSVLPAENNSFFYPSFTVSAVLSELLDMNTDVVSFLKLRGGWSQVGSKGILGPYSLQQTFGFADPFGTVLAAFDPSTLNNPNLIPETTTGTEVGIEAKLFNNRIRLDATYYNQLGEDLIVGVQVSTASGYSNVRDNVGSMRNSGVELQLGGTLFEKNDLSVDLDLNFAKNTSVVESLGGLETLVLGGQWDVSLQAREGLPYGVIVGPAFERSPDGQVVHDAGLPVIAGGQQILGNIAPDWTGGANLAINYKGITVRTTIDAKVGGDIHSMTTSWGRYAGVLEETLIGRETGIVGAGVMNVGSADNPVYETNNIVVPAESYNKRAYQNSVAESSVFDASFVKWRELIIGYKLPKSLFANNFINGASISLVGRNLAILHRNTPHIDPESAFSSANGEQGQEFGQLPSARSLGFNIQLSF